jgi:integrase/recombinase XerD
MSYVFVREPLNNEECDRIVNACRSFKEKLVVWTLIDSGLRVKEFCTLRREHIHWQENCLVVWGKGGWSGRRGKRRMVPLTVRAKRLLELHFSTNDRIGFSTRTAQRIVKRVANRAMITKPVTPHVLRHTFAVNCVKQSVSTASLKKILGHDKLETTEIYLNICPEDALTEFFQKVSGDRRPRHTWSDRDPR